MGAPGFARLAQGEIVISALETATATATVSAPAAAIPTADGAAALEPAQVLVRDASAAATPRAHQADQTHWLPRSHRSGIESPPTRASAPGSATRRARYRRRQSTCPSAASLMVRAKEVEGRHLPPCAMNRVAASRTFSSCSVPTSAGSTADSARAHCCRVNIPESMRPSSLKARLHAQESGGVRGAC